VQSITLDSHRHQHIQPRRGCHNKHPRICFSSTSTQRPLTTHPTGSLTSSTIASHHLVLSQPCPTPHAPQPPAAARSRTQAGACCTHHRDPKEASPAAKPAEKAAAISAEGLCCCITAAAHCEAEGTAMPGGDIRLRQGAGTSPGHEGAGQGQMLGRQGHMGDVLHKQHYGAGSLLFMCAGAAGTAHQDTGCQTNPPLLAARVSAFSRQQEPPQYPVRLARPPKKTQPIRCNMNLNAPTCGRRCWAKPYT
jgi:hypothetical protein